MPLTAPTTPPGLPASLDYPEVPVGSLIAAGAARWGDRTAFAHDGRSLTFAETYRAACRFAHALRERGVGRGDVVALHLPNCLAFPVAYYGTVLAGATFSPANPLLPPDDLAFQLADCEAAAVVTFGPVAGVLASVADRIPARLTVVVNPTADLPEGGIEFEAFQAGHPETTTSRTWPTPAAPPAGRRACGSPTATSWSTPCSTRAGAAVRCRHSTHTATSPSTRSAARTSGRRAWAPASRST
jgi:long-chain acyl-CoA synthetase